MCKQQGREKEERKIDGREITRRRERKEKTDKDEEGRGGKAIGRGRDEEKTDEEVRNKDHCETKSKGHKKKITNIG